MRKTKFLVAALAASSLFLQTSSVFAANPYGIEYSGGEALSASNVQINKSLIEGLTPLVSAASEDKVIEVSDSDKWNQAYYLADGVCTNYYYIKIYENGLIGSSDNLYYTVANNQYEIKIKINDVYLDGVTGLSADGNVIAVGVHDTARGNFSVGDLLYEDSTCSERIDNIVGLSLNNGQMYTDLTLKLYKKGENEVFTSDGMYFGVTDFDAAQSFKILNANDLLSPSNMFAVSEAALQNPDTSSDLRNMFNPDGYYLYSEYKNGVAFNSNYVNDIFVKVGTATQSEGLNLVFGFATGAGSGVQYYAKQYTVKYVSDKNGTITGITKEEIISGNNPTGSKEEPKEGYALEYWITSRDVTLVSGEKIEAGEPITADQIKRVIIDEDTTFTAIHLSSSTIKTPDTGHSTTEVNAVGIATSVTGVVLCGLSVALLPRIFRKRVKFN